MFTPPNTILLSVLAAAALASPARAVIVGIDDFSYANGPIAGQTGGTGWAYERTDEPGAPPQSASNWDTLFGAPQVTGGILVTNGGGAKREFGGPGTGSGEPSNEREGAFRASGVVYFSAGYSVDSLFAEGNSQWGGLSSYDFDAERIFFGMPGQASDRRFGIEIGGVGTALSSISINAGAVYNLVAALDFDNSLLKLWVNPDGADFDLGATSSADATLAYTAGNWSTAVRLASAEGANVSWDNLRVTTTFAEAVPEPSAALTAGLLGAAALLRRKRGV